MAGVDDIVLQVSQLTEVEELEVVKAAVKNRVAVLHSAQMDAAISKEETVPQDGDAKGEVIRQAQKIISGSGITSGNDKIDI